MDRFTGGCLCGNAPPPGHPQHTMALGGREGVLDAPDQLMPSYESWIVRRESWLPPFPLARRYETVTTRVAQRSRTLQRHIVRGVR